MRLEAIKSKQQKIFKELHYFKDFYLVGGTALALQIGHRVSVDFDLFTDKDLPPRLLNSVKRFFRGSKISVILRHPEQLSVEVAEVKIDFVKEKPLLLKPILFQGVKVAQVLEIMAMKAHTLGFRGKFKDYIDLYFVLKRKLVSLQDICDLAEKKYGGEFNARLFFEQLAYLDDLQETKIEFLGESVDKKILKAFFDQEIKKIKL